MTPEAIAFLFLLLLIVTAVCSVWWPWGESGDMVDEVDQEWQPIGALREIQQRTPAPYRAGARSL